MEKKKSFRFGNNINDRIVELSQTELSKQVTRNESVCHIKDMENHEQNLLYYRSDCPARFRCWSNGKLGFNFISGVRFAV